MKKYQILLILSVFLSSAYRQETAETKDVLIKKYFKNKNTYIIICKGYPKAGTTGMISASTAREAALLNAQVIASQTFDKSVDVIKHGRVLKYVMFETYAVVHYQVKKRGLKKKLKVE